MGVGKWYGCGFVGGVRKEYCGILDNDVVLWHWLVDLLEVRSPTIKQIFLSYYIITVFEEMNGVTGCRSDISLLITYWYT